MPAGSEGPGQGVGRGVALPHTFRPLGVRVVVYLLLVLMLGTGAVAWFAFPPEVRDQFNPLERATVLALALGAVAIGHALGRSRVVAEEHRVRIVNGYRTRTYDWNQVIGVALRRSAPWASVDISDGSTRPVMGIQASDGPRAALAVRRLRALVAQQTGRY